MACLRHRLPALGVDSYWVVDAASVRYLTGFTGQESTLLVTCDRSVLITDSRFDEQAAREACVDEVVVRRRGMAATAGLVSRRMGLRRTGFGSRHVSYEDWHAFGSEAGGAEAVPCRDDPVERMRALKCRQEVEAIAGAVRVAQTAFRRFLAQVEPGRTEKWLAGRLEWEMVEAGAEGAAFQTICAVDERASLPHAVPTGRRVGPDSALLVDWGARCGGYACDLTRVVATGKIPSHVERLTQLVVAAQEAAFERMAPGVRCAEVDHAARSVVLRAGYGAYFGHGLGHGVGLGVHEAPRLGAGETELLLPGMVVTVEPGVYLPGRGGVRIEDVVLITKDGHELLSSLSRGPGDPQEVL